MFISLGQNKTQSVQKKVIANDPSTRDPESERDPLKGHYNGEQNLKAHGSTFACDINSIE